MTLFEGPVAFTFLHHLLMSYFMTSFSCKDCLFSHHPLGCEKEVSTLMANWTKYLLCLRELVKICLPLSQSTPGWQNYQDFSSKFISRVYVSIRICFCMSPCCSFWKTPPDSPGLMKGQFIVLHSPLEAGHLQAASFTSTVLPSLVSRCDP